MRLSRAALLLSIVAIVGIVPGHPTSSLSKQPSDAGSAETTGLQSAEDDKRVEALEKKIDDFVCAGKFAEAAEPARAILSIRSRAHGKDHWQTSDARRLVASMERLARLPAETRAELADAARLQNEARQLVKRAEYSKAEKLCRRALEVLTKQLGNEDLDTVAECCNDLALVLDYRGRYPEAQHLYEKALDIKRKALGEKNPSTAALYNNLAINLRRQGHNAEAESLHMKALDIRRSTLGEANIDTAQSYNSLAASLYSQARYNQAEPLYRKALDIRRKVLGDGHADVGMSCVNLGFDLSAQGRYADAEPLLRKGLEIVRKAVGEENPDTAIAYTKLALNLIGQGRYAEAQPLLERALDIRGRILGPEHPDTALSYDFLGRSLYYQGHYAEAQPFSQKAVDLFRKTVGDAHPYTAICYMVLGDELTQLGRYGEAQFVLQKALDAELKMGADERAGTALCYSYLANNLTRQGRFVEAQPWHEKALEGVRRVLGEFHPDTVTCYTNLASTLSHQRRDVEAEALLRRAAQCFQVARLRSGFGLERASFRIRCPLPALAACLAREGKAREAWHALESCFARGLLDEASSRLVQPLSPGQAQRQQQLSGQLDALQEQIGKLLGKKGKQDAWQAQLEDLTRQRALAEAELARLVAQSEDKEVYDVKRIQSYISPETAVVAWLDVPAQTNTAEVNGEHWACVLRRSGEPNWVRLVGSGAGGAWTGEDDELPIRFRQALGRPGQENAASLDRMRSQLEAGRFAPLKKALQASDRWPTTTRIVCLSAWSMAGVPIEMLTNRYTISYAPSATIFAKLRDQHKPMNASASGILLGLGDPVIRQLASRSEPPPPDHGVLIEGVVAGSRGERSGIKAGDVIVEYAGRKLFKTSDLTSAIAEVQPSNTGKDESKKRIVPVRVWRGGRTLDLHVQPGRLGVQLNLHPAADVILAKREGDRAVRASEGDIFEQLPGTRKEVESVAALFTKPLILLGPEASVQRLDELASNGELQRFRYIHLATHGVMNDQIAMQSALILSHDDLPDAAQQVLAGKPASDGRLTAERVLKRWRLDADLVALSACQSGLGKNAGGEGYLGFSQALFLAGARSLVLSLWKVDDTATALLMQRFYQNLLGKRADLKAPMPKAEALAEAKGWMRSLTRDDVNQEQLALARGERRKLQTEAMQPSEHPYAHPYYWAAFILIGDPD